MDMNKTSFYGMMGSKMNYLAQRQDVLSHNIANADTPGYRPKDLKKLDFGKMALLMSNKLDMRMTNARHLTGTKMPTGDFKELTQKRTFETDPVKNSVVVEEQMVKVAETSMDYQMITNLYKKSNDMAKLALGTR